MGFLKNIIFRVLGVLVGDYWKGEKIWVGVSCPVTSITELPGR